MDEFVYVNNINIHYLDYGGNDPPLLLLPGLTANAHSFEGLIAAGLNAQRRVLAVDFRGRGLSDKPAVGYSMGEYAADILALMDMLEIATAVLCGHSFGALVSLLLAAQNRERFPKIVIIDASHLLVNPQTAALIKASIDRLGVTLPSLDLYLAAMQQMPYLNGFWDKSIETYFRADVHTNADGTVQPHTRPDIIAETIEKQLSEPWESYVAAIMHPVLLLNASASYGPPGTQPLLPEKMARKTVAMFDNGRYQKVPGNHVTMIFGENAPHVVQAILEFIKEDST